MVDRKDAISISRNGRPAVYVVSPKLFEAAFRGSAAPSPTRLHRLQQDFDRMVAKMQRPEHAVAMNELQTMDSAVLARTVRAPARSKRGRKSSGTG